MKNELDYKLNFINTLYEVKLSPFYLNRVVMPDETVGLIRFDNDHDIFGVRIA